MLSEGWAQDESPSGERRYWKHWLEGVGRPYIDIRSPVEVMVKQNRDLAWELQPCWEWRLIHHSGRTLEFGVEICRGSAMRCAMAAVDGLSEAMKVD